jgi:hypothetical protein
VSLQEIERLSTLKVVWKILGRRERKLLFGILILMITGSILETFSLGLVVPVIALLTRPNYLENFPGVDNFLGNPTDTQLVFGAFTCSVFTQQKLHLELGVSYLKFI